jgi:hypothetical protein
LLQQSRLYFVVGGLAVGAAAIYWMGGVPLLVEKRANVGSARMLCGGSDGWAGHLLLVRLPVRR